MATLTLQTKNNRIRESIVCGLFPPDQQYITGTALLQWKCTSCTNIFTRSYERMFANKHRVCSSCTKDRSKTSKSLTHTQVKCNISKTKCTLLSTEYKNNSTPLRIRCHCGVIFDRSYNAFNSNTNKSCDVCAGKIQWNTESVSTYVLGVGSKLIGQYTPNEKSTFLCGGCRGEYKQQFQDFVKASHVCPSCAKKSAWEESSKKIQLADVMQMAMTSSIVLLSTTIANINDPLMFECHCGEQYTQTFSVFRSRKVKQCPSCSAGIDRDTRNLLTFDNLKQLHEIDKKTLGQIAFDVGVSKQTVSNLFNRYNIPIMRWSAPSVGETELATAVQLMVGETDVVLNSRHIIPPYELDIYLPDHNLAIEYCGLYWHSSARISDTRYHKRKFDMCAKQGIVLLTIFEDEWVDHSDIVLSTIRYRTNHQPNHSVTYARKTKCVSVSTDKKREFLNKYHIQGDGRGSVWYGLIDGSNNLVAVVGLVRVSGEWMLNRYCTSGVVVGGFTKLLSHFSKNNDWDVIYTFADNRWSVGDLYLKTGFAKVSDVKPDYQYVKNGVRHHKFGFRRNHLPVKLDVYDETLSERENCKMNNYFQIWDCGKTKFAYTNT